MLFKKFRFDEEWYLAVYPDVRATVRAGHFRSGYAHYKFCGRAEGRLPRQPRFDEPYYLATNPDVGKAVALGEFKSGFDHYMRYGFREHRRTMPRA